MENDQRFPDINRRYGALRAHRRFLPGCPAFALRDVQEQTVHRMFAALPIGGCSTQSDVRRWLERRGITICTYLYRPPQTFSGPVTPLISVTDTAQVIDRVEVLQHLLNAVRISGDRFETLVATWRRLEAYGVQLRLDHRLTRLSGLELSIECRPCPRCEANQGGVSVPESSRCMPTSDLVQASRFKTRPTKKGHPGASTPEMRTGLELMIAEFIRAAAGMNGTSINRDSKSPLRLRGGRK